jgi:hypothetical protein
MLHRIRLQNIVTAAVVVLALAPAAAFAQAAAKSPAADARQNLLVERKAAESQYRQDRIAALQKGDACIKAAATQKAFSDCEKAEAAELKAAGDKVKTARARVQGEVREQRAEAQAKRKDAPKQQ